MAEVVIVPTPDDAATLVADAVIDLIGRKPRAVLGLATGSTPSPVYRAIAARINEVDASQVQGFALDEYAGLPASHPQSYRAVITREVVEPMGLTPALVHVPRGDVAHLRTAGSDYEAQIRTAGGIDLQLLGIGGDGHIGFNEPGSSFASLTRVKTLAQQTREDNARFFSSIDEVPSHSITQGLGTILRARHLVLLAFGSAKAAVVQAAIEGPLTASIPASVLQMHPHVTIVVDEAAAGQLRNAEYYRYAYANKPAWQGL
ncbi:MAG: glucosamine-6-phosphate deaminase [Microbacteriaceae bacterium]|jgi:glucosamine-6-phosphate deaminase|nr:glucosamine-6-phosphate deaminase [Microbacteriaceae bacterium]HOA87638.1 glucosamine-6-phosphate deaminase [Microbacteriaceae bacterium]HPZ35215.1 glucosamine-6-phosphate deaminase [Microbacteriaceae bacterium]HQC92670.1 glucosamine-6-phosphate deaminase [Microbacteriaceae bacterium]